MTQGLHRRFQGQQEKQVVLDSKLRAAKINLNRIYSAVVEGPGDCSLMLVNANVKEVDMLIEVTVDACVSKEMSFVISMPANKIIRTVWGHTREQKCS